MVPFLTILLLPRAHTNTPSQAHVCLFDNVDNDDDDDKDAEAARLNHEQVTWNTSGVYHVKYVVCHLVRRDSTAIKFG